MEDGLLYGGIEAGGTKFVCVVAGGPEDIRAQTRIETTVPEETISRATAFFKDFMCNQRIEAIGIGSFGPVDLDPESPTRGSITTTPKFGWARTDMAGMVHQSLGLPVMMDTDVNAAALGEGLWGAARDVDNYLYITVGTGIGGGAVVNGRILHGMMHPEMGHMLIKHDLRADTFTGCCPFHGDCLEGLASGYAIKQRWGRAAGDLPSDHPAWRLEAGYLAEAVLNLICVLSPARIILGGGVSGQPRLLPLVRQRVKELLNGYIAVPLIIEHMDEYLVPPALGDLSGVLGAVALACSTDPIVI